MLGPGRDWDSVPLNVPRPPRVPREVVAKMPSSLREVDVSGVRERDLEEAGRALRSRQTSGVCVREGRRRAQGGGRSWQGATNEPPWLVDRQTRPIDEGRMGGSDRLCENSDKALNVVLATATWSYCE